MKTQIKKLIALLVIVALSMYAEAQKITGGITAGITTGAVKIDKGFDNIMKGENIYGFEGGFYLKPKFGPFYVKPNLLYNYSGGDVSTQPTLENSSTARFNMHKLTVPVLLGLHILGPVTVDAGPVYNYILGVTKTYNNNEVELNKNGLGYRVGAGLDFGVLMLNVHYQGITYRTSGSQASFSEPNFLTFGLNVRLGNDNKE